MKCRDVIQIDVQNLKSIVKINLREGKSSHPKIYNRQVKNVRRFFPSDGKLVCCRIDQKQFDEKVAAFVIDGMHPLSIVENERFKDLFSGVYPTLALMLRRSLGCHIFQKADEVYAKIKTDLSQQAFLCTTADVSSTKHRSFMGVTVHWVGIY
ncbi:hypothetical protein Avbf_08060 [Armadillidium vulgare]|nr:hypothetical protein Avbf_08060 [Armadillidium vulgare]